MILKLNDVHQAYGSRMVLRQISFELKKGEGIALTGPNGAGKTTLLKLLAGLIRPHSGTIEAPHRLLSLFMGEAFFYRELSLEQNLSFFSSLYTSPSSRLLELIPLFGLAPFFDRPVSTLSRGEKMRGALARTFLKESPLYLLDEPFSGLDDPSIDILQKYLTSLKRQGKSFLIATHDRESAKTLADRWFQLEGGFLHA